MTELFTAIAVLFAMMLAIQQLRRQRAAGIRTDWTKTWVTIGAVLLSMVIGVGALFLGVYLGGQDVGFIAFFFVVIVCTIGFSLLINRWRPPPKID